MGVISLTNKEYEGVVKDDCMTLMNGSVVQCYPKAMPEEPCVRDKEQDEKDKLFFLKHAFFFYEHVDRIFSDSRMFLARVPVRSGLAYVGTGGFESPTLGVYLEWWLNGECRNTQDEKGKKALTYHLAGSPLSGCNKCSCVYADGTTKIISFCPFRPAWQSFIKVNRRYKEAREKFEAYTLQEVWKLLQTEQEGEISSLRSQVQILESQNRKMKKQLKDLNDKYTNLLGRYDGLCVRHYQEKLDDFATEYHRRERDVEIDLETIAEEKRTLKRQLKEGYYDLIVYQQLVHPLSVQRKTLIDELNAYKYEQIRDLTAEGDLTVKMILEYLKGGA